MSRRLLTLQIAAAATAAAGRALRGTPPGGAEVWARQNHRGEPVTLLEGPAYAAGAATGSLLAPGVAPSVRAAGALATLGAAGLGCYDDLAGSSSSRGLGGHLRALARGEVSTGTIKLGGLGLTGLVAAGLVHAGDRRGRVGRLADVAISGALIAGTANLINLFDLRPGRALKAVAALGLLTGAAGGPSGPLAGAVVGPALAALPADLGERSMLGDCGANAAGALLGVTWAAGRSRPTRMLLLAGVTGLTLASERVSFTAVIESTPALRALDQLGRRPVDPTP